MVFPYTCEFDGVVITLVVILWSKVSGPKMETLSSASTSPNKLMQLGQID